MFSFLLPPHAAAVDNPSGENVEPSTPVQNASGATGETSADQGQQANPTITPLQLLSSRVHSFLYSRVDSLVTHLEDAQNAVFETRDRTHAALRAALDRERAMDDVLIQQRAVFRSLIEDPLSAEIERSTYNLQNLMLENGRRSMKQFDLYKLYWRFQNDQKMMGYLWFSEVRCYPNQFFWFSFNFLFNSDPI